MYTLQISLEMVAFKPWRPVDAIHTLTHCRAVLFRRSGQRRVQETEMANWQEVFSDGTDPSPSWYQGRGEEQKSTNSPIRTVPKKASSKEDSSYPEVCLQPDEAGGHFRDRRFESLASCSAGTEKNQILKQNVQRIVLQLAYV